MTAGSPLAAAFLRGIYLAIGSFLFAFLPAWAVTEDIKGPLISGGLAALWALGFRGGFEGNFDTSRASNNDVRASDVPVAAPDVVVTEPAKP
jgi:hypothetical protein